MNQFSRPVLLLATSNPGKRHEFVQLLPPEVVVKTLDDLDIALPPETGATFRANADAKAVAGSLQSGLPTLADDSGLEVVALDGAPGNRSARFAGEPPSDERNRLALLDVLRDVPTPARAARFVCAVSLAEAGTVIARAEGQCAGSIALAPSGEFGFGYDPIFRLADGRMMAELSRSEKNRISHRAVAYRQVMPALLEALGLDLALGVSR